MQNYSKYFLTAGVLILLALPACTVSTINSGNKNFERAWSAFTYDQLDKAQSYFNVAAADYKTALSEDPPDRTTRFSSTLIKIGMSAYYAGQYEECIESMRKAHRKNERIWEVDLYSSLAYGRLGDKENAIKQMSLFLQGMSSQRIITNAVAEQHKMMQDGTTTLADSVSAIEASIHNQITSNISINQTPYNGGLPNERCSGTYWWRMNRKPCNSQRLQYD